MRFQDGFMPSDNLSASKRRVIVLSQAQLGNPHTDQFRPDQTRISVRRGAVDRLNKGSKMGTIITCAVTGGGDTVSRHPLIPVTPREIADAAIAPAPAGVAIIHLHARDPEAGQQSRDPELFAESYP
ncbi:hypothetical protein HJB67_27435 [Rhizobium lentis]|uniref:3-keto-5-aminohexanoate cleavage protein n=1 Tax=Rhizobium lentis TaxID=1138194 RepID=UPI00287F5D97|nr:3-keto-5-aminohexanoate cleavage protein [Rhizobium lentis]MBX5013658.1 hypothetical protein [Rhizobium lentis]